MKNCALIMIMLLYVSCDKSSECWDEIERISKKTKVMHKINGITLNKKLEKVRMWQDSLKYHKSQVNNKCKNIEFHGKLMYTLNKEIVKNREFIRTHEKINE